MFVGASQSSTLRFETENKEWFCAIKLYFSSQVLFDKADVIATTVVAIACFLIATTDLVVAITCFLIATTNIVVAIT